MTNLQRRKAAHPGDLTRNSACDLLENRRLLVVDQPSAILTGEITAPDLSVKIPITLRAEYFDFGAIAAQVNFRVRASGSSQLDPAEINDLDSIALQVLPTSSNEDCATGGNLSSLELTAAP